MDYTQAIRSLTRGMKHEVVGKGRYAIVVKRSRIMTLYCFDSEEEALSVMYKRPSVKDYVYDLETEERV